MKVEVKVPAMGESISEATIGTLLKSSGAAVAVDDELIELETDKVNQVLYASHAGTIVWDVAQGDVVKIGQVLGNIDTDKKGAKPAAAKEVKSETPPSEVVPSQKKQSVKAEKKTPPQREHSSQGARSSKEQFIAELAAPASSLAPLAHVETKEEKPIKAPSVAPAPLSSEGRETRKPMTKIRKVIATRLVEALQNTAMLTTFNEVDMSKIMGLREVYKEEFNKQHHARLGFMSFFIKASVSAMKAFPEINSYIDGSDIVYRNYFDISIAVGTDRGLVVPVVRGCDRLSFAEIESTIEVLGKKAREGGLTVDDLQGGGFTITNGGVYGSLLSTPILNMPQSAILGMHKIMKRAVVVDDQIVIRPMMNLALSYDHRVVDGKEAVSFLVHIKNCLEDPSRILLGV